MTGTGYEGVAEAWAAGPSRVYDRLAADLVADLPADLSGLHIVDLGAGTGAAARALIARGARVTALDAAPDMVTHMLGHGIDAVGGDLLDLPFDDSEFDAAVAAFSVSHVDRPARSLAEARRVVIPGGQVLVGCLAAHPVKGPNQVVDAVAEEFGFVRPAWYVRFKRDLEPLTNTEAALARCAADAGLVDVVVTARAVDAGVSTAEDIVASRTGMAHLAPFVAGLGERRREAFIAAAVQALGPTPEPLRPTILVLSSRTPQPRAGA